MNNNTNDELRQRVAQIIHRAWPCYVHYADPRELVDDDEETRWLLTQLDATAPTAEAPTPSTVESAFQITEAMVRGHEFLPACLAMAKAITRCIPALTQLVQSERCPSLDRDDQHAVRAALADAHRLHHRLDPACGQDDTPLLEALCTQENAPLEVSADWLYMVRMTQDEVMGAPLGALDELPMRCFTDLAHARNWAVMLCGFECLRLMGDIDANLSDPRHTSIVTEIASHDGSDRHWRLPFTNVTLRFTVRPDAAPQNAVSGA